MSLPPARRRLVDVRHSVCVAALQVSLDSFGQIGDACDEARVAPILTQFHRVFLCGNGVLDLHGNLFWRGVNADIRFRLVIKSQAEGIPEGP